MRITRGHIDLCCRLALAVVFLVAGIPKLLHPVQFGGIIDAYGLLPELLILPAAFFVSALEVAAGVALLLGRRIGMHLSAFLLLLFIVVLSYGIILGLDIDCGCFSISDPEHQAFSGMRSALIRDLVLLIPLGYLYWQSVTVHQKQRI